ncbi:class I SAM-dependent methyltransferase [Hwanghaeella grinnelliae]|uniref:class I SAM-dependent methyltransferase n=1 Tax=Hwanghaeella grinnelliae TaxID=2500179 RepID=UPI001F01FA69|nr:SAM-dependent methyltransferase [Hwanghaeella grinnelliae]
MKRCIALDGPLTVADFMAAALGHPQYGYYRTRDPLGMAGDFTTAPEISQVFGELIGLWMAEMWRLHGSSTGVRLVELGPGRGTLMADMLRAASRMPGFLDAITIHMVETSPTLRRAQGQALAAYAKVTWHDNLTEVPDGQMLLVANEFLDALPIHQLVRTEKGWCEKLVVWDESTDRPVFGLSPGASPVENLLADNVRRNSEIGAVAEVSPHSLAVATEIAQRLQSGIAALIVDYGYRDSAAGDTLQAVKNHDYAPVLDNIGEADLTAHVDFAAVGRAAAEAGATPHGPITQRDFMLDLGALHRRDALLARATPAQAKVIKTSVQRLIDPKEMGTLFKVMAVTANSEAAANPPPGF